MLFQIILILILLLLLRNFRKEIIVQLRIMRFQLMGVKFENKFLTHIGGGVTIERGVIILSGAKIHKSHISKGCEIGCEVIRSKIGENVKAKHSSIYIGDATVGNGCNIEAGTVFCNYNGTKKHRTTVQDDVFIGSGSKLIAPITISAGSFIAADSVIGEDIPPNSFVIARGQRHGHSEIDSRGEILIKKNYIRKDEKGWYKKTKGDKS